MLRNFFLTIWRTLRRNITVTVLNIIGLSAGMTAAILIFLWVNNEMTYDNYHPDAGRIYRVTTWLSGAKWTWATSPLRLAAATRTNIPQVEAVAAIQPLPNVTFRIGDDLFTEQRGALIDSGWFSMFHYDFLAGSPAELSRRPFSLVLSRSKAKKYFGNKDPIGQSIRIDSNIYRVAAVMRDAPANSSFQFDVLIPVDSYLTDPQYRDNTVNWSNYHFLTFLRLRPGADTAKTAAAITAIVHRNQPNRHDDHSHQYLVPLKDMHFETDLTSGPVSHMDRSIVYLFSALGAFLLLIACINYVNLTTARAAGRAKEVGIRKIIGAGNGRLFSRFLLESLIVSSLAMIVTVFLITLAMPLFRQLTDRSFTDPFASAGTWWIMGATLLAATILNGIYPSLLLSSFKPLNVLKGAILPGFRDASLRRALVVFQFTFSIVLIIGILVIREQLFYIQHANPGYDRAQVFYFTYPHDRLPYPANQQSRARLAGVKHQLLSNSGILDVTIASESLVDIKAANSGSIDWEGRDKSWYPTLWQLSVDEDYQKVLQLQLKEGRWFDPLQPTDRGNFILNETAIREFHLPSPVLGQRLIFQRDTGEVIGIVKDFHFASLHDKITPLLINSLDNWRSCFFVRTRPGRAAEALAAARRIWQQYLPDRPFDYAFLDDEFNQLYRTDRKVSSLMLVFSLAAILISCLGLFGLAAFTAQQRTREIGIRKVLGAGIAGIVTLLSADFIRLVLLSICIATPVAWWAMNKWLQNFAYHIPLSGWIFILAGAITLFIAVLTISTQSIRAATTNPVKNLRTE